MKRIRIYQPGHYQPGDTVALSASAGQHTGIVLRMQPGDPLTLFCNDNHEYAAVIDTAHKKQVTVHIKDKIEANRESPRAIHLAQSISKGDRMDWVVQKAVELGVTSITPIRSERTVVKLDEKRLLKKQAQWEAIAISACEQCGRNTLPLIHPVMAYNDYLQQSQAAIKLVLAPQNAKTWHDYDLSQGDIALLIGPEGGLTDEEIHQAREHHFQVLRLGPRVLRTETAALSALSMLQAVCGDL